MEDSLIWQVGGIGLLFVGLFVLAWGFERARLPVLLGFMAGGLLMQRFTPPLLAPAFPLIGEIAVWLLFFFVGLEYSPENLLRLSRSIVKPGLIDWALNFGVVSLLAALWAPPTEALLLGAALYPSSTAIVARLLLEYRRLASPEAELLLGILIFEDVVGVLLLGVLTPISQGSAISWLLVGKILGALVGVIGAFIVIYRWGVPWLMRRVPAVGDHPLAVFWTLGLVLVVGAAGHEIGLSGVLTAFLLGVLIPEESAFFRAAEKSLGALRELSVGLFFFAISFTVEIEKLPVGMGLLWIGVGIGLKFASTWWAARVWGVGPRVALRAALSFLPKGEFSLLFAALSHLWRSTIILVVLGSSGIGALSFGWADRVVEWLFPRRRAAKAQARKVSE